MASLKEFETDFKRLVKNDLLGHGYILYGPDRKQQFSAAKMLANFLESKKYEEPSGILIETRLIDGVKQELGVDVARSFSEFLYRQPVRSPKRTLIVNAAGDLTTQAQNALLKIAEEPPSHALILLIVRDLNLLLPPLVSRFQKIYISSGASQRILSSTEQEAKNLVETFLMSTPKGRSDLIKELVANEKEVVAKEEKIVDTFVELLIEELAKKPEANWRALKHLLARQRVLGDFNVNRRLQLEAVLPFLS